MAEPEVKFEKVEAKGKTKEVETWYLGQGQEIHNSIGCDHNWVQVTGTQVECQKCRLGLFGHVLDGKLVQ